MTTLKKLYLATPWKTMKVEYLNFNMNKWLFEKQGSIRCKNKKYIIKK